MNSSKIRAPEKLSQSLVRFRGDFLLGPTPSTLPIADGYLCVPAFSEVLLVRARIWSRNKLYLFDGSSGFRYCIIERYHPINAVEIVFLKAAPSRCRCSTPQVCGANYATHGTTSGIERLKLGMMIVTSLRWRR